MNPKKFIIHCDTKWCGCNGNYSAIAYDESELQDIAEQTAFDNVYNDLAGGFTTVLEELFDTEDEDDLTPEQLQEAYDEERASYSYTIHEFDPESDGEFDWYELVYDCTNKDE